MAVPTGDTGIIQLRSSHSVRETLDKLEHILRDKGIHIFARIDQQKEAQQVGLTLRATELLIFGNPKAGTPIMDAAPSSALDLPLKVAAWDDGTGGAWVGYNSPEFLRERHGLDAEQAAKLDVGPLIRMAIA